MRKINFFYLLKKKTRKISFQIFFLTIKKKEGLYYSNPPPKNLSFTQKLFSPTKSFFIPFLPQFNCIRKVPIRGIWPPGEGDLPVQHLRSVRRPEILTAHGQGDVLTATTDRTCVDGPWFPEASSALIWNEETGGGERCFGGRKGLGLGVGILIPGNGGGYLWGGE